MYYDGLEKGCEELVSASGCMYGFAYESFRSASWPEKCVYRRDEWFLRFRAHLVYSRQNVPFAQKQSDKMNEC
jgi:hypothetical protein